uniref:Leucine rich repeat containing 75A n=1 Tax=Nothobranchius furzeri TaxID=105023 RepID=A0A8C6M3R0_NOTFU
DGPREGRRTSIHLCARACGRASDLPPYGTSTCPHPNSDASDLGMESTSLDDVLYRYASFRNLVDPITHDLIISLARYVHCPKTVGYHTHSQKVCRQLTYHLSPHSQWRRRSLLKRKPQACVKAVLTDPLSTGALDLSGIPLTIRDMERLCAHLQRHASTVVSLELGFTELTDEAFLQLLPTLASLPHLETLALNGNRLTRAILKELTDALKDPNSFPSVTWIDLGNNVDIFSLPQPFLVSLRKRCPKQGNLPTILEFGESQATLTSKMYLWISDSAHVSPSIHVLYTYSCECV